MTTVTEPAVATERLRAFTLRDVPWGQLGTKIEPGTVVTAAEAAHLGGLDFEVELRPAGYLGDVPTRNRGSRWREVPRKAVVRKDTDEFFQFVSNADYTPVQYAEAFSFMDAISPDYAAAGTLFGGRQGFLVVKLGGAANRPLFLRGVEDPHDVYVVLRTSHDMTRALEVNVLNLRAKCMNALALRSFSAGAQQRWSVKHTGDPWAKLAEAREVLTRTIDYQAEFARIAHELVDIDVHVEDSREILRRVLPVRPTTEDKIELIVRSMAGETNGFAGTGWGLVNAVSEFYEWGRPEGMRTPESRFIGSLTGDTAKFTNRTAQLLLARN